MKEGRRERCFGVIRSVVRCLLADRLPAQQKHDYENKPFRENQDGHTSLSTNFLQKHTTIEWPYHCLSPLIYSCVLRAKCVQSVASTSIGPYQIRPGLWANACLNIFSVRTPDWNTPTTLLLLGWHSSSHQDGVCMCVFSVCVCQLEEHRQHVSREIGLWALLTAYWWQVSVNSAHSNEFYSLLWINP